MTATAQRSLLGLAILSSAALSFTPSMLPHQRTFSLSQSGKLLFYDSASRKGRMCRSGVSRDVLTAEPPAKSSFQRTSSLSQSAHSSDLAMTKPSLKKKGNKRKAKRRTGSPKQRIPAGGISQDDLVEHVSSLYTYGPGGTLQRKASKLRPNDVPHQSNNSNAGEPFLKKLDRHPALVLNADYQPMSFLPLSLWHWQEAVKAVFSGKVTVVDVYPDVTVRAANWEIPLPSVIALNEYVPLHHQKPAFTKRNVFLRDEYRCQYCRDAFKTSDLTLDHVVPRCMGGRLQWTNAVTCCDACNSRKGSLSVKELRHVGMKLHREPRIPTQHELAAVAGRMLPRRTHTTWEPFLQQSRTSTV